MGFIFSLSNPWANFNIASNSQDFSLSSSNISSGSVGFYQFSNPALLPKTNNYSFGMCYNSMALDRSVQTFSFNFQLPPKAGIGLSILRSGTSDIPGRDTYNNPTNTFDNYDILGMVSFGVSMNEYISIGINIKASYSNLNDLFQNDNEANYSISSNGVGIDMGISYDYSKLSLGVKVENIESSKNWNLNLGDESGTYEEKIPIIYKIGTHYKISDQLILYVENDNIDNINSTKCGMDYNINSFGIQTGFDFEKTLPSLGVYYSWEMFKLNYGVNIGSVGEGISHIFTFTFIN